MSTKLHLGDLQPNNIKWITLDDFEYLCFGLAKAHMEFDQPIPDFVSRNPGILESCIETPLQSFGGNYLYPTFTEKLSLVFYLLIKNHPFQNGNKRIAVATLFVILYLNKLWIETGELVPYELAKEIAASKREEKNRAIQKISNFISKNLTKF